MAKNTKQPAKERKCRKNIATLLSLMGFKDEDPAATVKIMLAKLKKIQEKAEFKKTGHSTFKKPVSTFKKVTFKCGGKTTTVSLKPLTPHSSNGDHNMQVTDSRNNNNNIVCYSENKKNTMMMLINNNADHHQDYSDQSFEKNLQQLMKKNVDVMELKINGGHDNYMEIADSRNNNSNVSASSESSSFDQMMNDDDCGGCMELHSFIASMSGSEARLVIEKQLTSSDVNKGLGRLLIPHMNVKNCGFLTSDERRKLGNKKDISVPMFDLERRELTVNLARWSMNKEVYVLKTGWNNIVKANGLEQGMVIQVWAFRVMEEQLCFALVSV